MKVWKNSCCGKKLESIRNFTYLYFIRIKLPLVSTPKWQTITIQAREKCLWIHQGKKRARLERKTPLLQQRERRLGGPRHRRGRGARWVLHNDGAARGDRRGARTASLLHHPFSPTLEFHCHPPPRCASIRNYRTYSVCSVLLVLSTKVQ